MLWIVIAGVFVVVTIVAAVLFIVPRGVMPGDIGAVSDEWIARHRVNGR
jgi:cytochrome b